jgi:hypothetical protein
MALNLEDLATEMRRIVPENEYYAITFTADDSGKIWWSAQSPDNMAKLWSDLGEPFVVVNELTHLYVYLRWIGGNASSSSGWLRSGCPTT